MRGAKPGERRGGRAKGTPNKTKSEIREIAQQHSAAAIKRIAKIMDNADDRIALPACIHMLDRAYGKPAQIMAGDKENPVEVMVGFRESLRVKLDRLAQSRPD